MSDVQGVNPTCRECREGKCVNCDALAWSDKYDCPVQCQCWIDNHKLTTFVEERPTDAEVKEREVTRGQRAFLIDFAEWLSNQAEIDVIVVDEAVDMFLVSQGWTIMDMVADVEFKESGASPT